MCKGFENRLCLVVVILSVKQIDMQRNHGIHRKRTEEFLHHGGIHISQTIVSEFCMEDQIRTTTDIDTAGGKGFVHWDCKITVAGNAVFIRKGVRKCLA